MKVCVSSPIQARSIQRISAALARYAPAEVVTSRDDADLIVHIVVGVGNFESVPINELIDFTRPYAIVQCCLMSTEQKTPDFWRPLWEHAEVVWSYLDLRAFAPSYDFNFYYAPLGVDPVFYDRHCHRDIDLLTTGYVAETECVYAAAEAVARIGGKHMHVGPNFNLGPHSSHMLDVSDEQMAYLYSCSRYVAGLRRDEGFELPAAEGLACGARPIMLDAPHYRQWFDGFAEFVPEDTDAVVSRAIETVLRCESDNVPSQLFNWQHIVEGFWQLALKEYPCSVLSLT